MIQRLNKDNIKIKKSHQSKRMKMPKMPKILIKLTKKLT